MVGKMPVLTLMLSSRWHVWETLSKNHELLAWGGNRLMVVMVVRGYHKQRKICCQETVVEKEYYEIKRMEIFKLQSILYATAEIYKILTLQIFTT